MANRIKPPDPLPDESDYGEAEIHEANDRSCKYTTGFTSSEFKELQISCFFNVFDFNVVTTMVMKWIETEKCNSKYQYTKNLVLLLSFRKIHLYIQNY